MMELLDPIVLTQFAVGGILAGALYALLACGLNLVFGVMKVINLAHAELMLLGSFLTWLLFTTFEIHPLVALPFIMVVLFFFGYGLQRVLIERIVGTTELSSLMVTYGLAIIMMNLGLLIFSSDFKAVPALQGAWFLWDEIIISIPRGVAGIVALLVTLSVYLFLEKARIGKAIRAVAEHADVALICGIDVVKIRMITFGLSAAMAGAAGVMLSMIYSFSPETGPDFILKCFAIIIIGGMGNFAGAFFGGLLLGVVEAFTAGFISTQWAEGVAYMLLVIILLVRPTGLRGKAHA
ncbi:MAG: branched-chain amino acid ABC transporter permease [Magnetococcales bacterium]|nr:branched-chain amino acid ABC transporter permease [Magnetococcales bacterium]